MRILSDKNWCVYLHRADGEVFYVGKGQAHRAVNNVQRNPVWHAVIKAHRYFDVEIVAWFDTEAEALERESAEILRHTPRANKRGWNNPSWPARIHVKSKVLDILSDRSEYYTVQQVANMLEVKETTVRLWLRNKKLKAIKAGHSWRVPLSSIQDL